MPIYRKSTDNPLPFGNFPNLPDQVQISLGEPQARPRKDF
jgi:hypothetical protein